MFSWLGILKGLIALADVIAKIAHDKQLLEAGEYKAIARANGETLNNIRAAHAARNAPGVPEDIDPDNRNNR